MCRLGKCSIIEGGVLISSVERRFGITPEIEFRSPKVASEFNISNLRRKNEFRCMYFRWRQKCITAEEVYLNTVVCKT